MPKEVAPIPTLEKLLAKQRARLKSLETKKRRLTAQVAKIDREIESLKGKAPAPKEAPRRRRGGKSLRQHVMEVLAASAEPRTAAEITQAVVQAGYRSSSKSLVSLVRQLCYKSDLIQKKTRGKFVAAGASTPSRRPRKAKKPAAKKE